MQKKATLLVNDLSLKVKKEGQIPTYLRILVPTYYTTNNYIRERLA